MGDFNILASLGVSVPATPIHPITRTSTAKVFAPLQKAPAAPAARKDPPSRRIASSSATGSRPPSQTADLALSLSSNLGASQTQSDAQPSTLKGQSPAQAPYVTSAQLATMSLEDKKALLAAMRDAEASRGAVSTAPAVESVVDHCKDAWCPSCINELNAAKRALLEKMEREKEKQNAAQQLADAKRLAEIDAKLAQLKRARERQDAQDAYKNAQQARDERARLAAEEQARVREAQDEMRREDQRRYAEEQRRIREQAAENAREREAECRRRQEQAQQQREEERRMLETGVGIVGRPEEDAAARRRRIEELNEHVREHNRIKEEERERLREEQEAENARLRQQATELREKAARDAQEQRELNRRNAREVLEEIEAQKRAGAEERANRVANERAALSRAQDLERAERQAQAAEQARARDSLRRMYEEDAEARRINQELSGLIARATERLNERPRVVEHLVECDRCEAVEKPQNMMHLSKEEVAEAGKYIPLKKVREPVASAKLVKSMSQKPPATPPYVAPVSTLNSAASVDPLVLSASVAQTRAIDEGKLSTDDLLCC
ncbi:hypothetical protein GMRT_15095 [Giardia muris]|uniref:Uncharacterized protein n=1 Tax=Giardia muris TaxID=5742 RepID=A0A4Z1STK5_GIAMU|nr:hypothetical protein GMRT_15095 [Giardia muris]|eukprot:TNJ26968.1 hypothetical protein GMRT_15095 [Giardia muris]